MSSLQYHQRATLEPVYRRVEILEQFTISLRRAYEELNKQFESIHPTLRLHAPEKAPPFHLVRRVWRPSESDLGLRPYFAYAFFNRESFTPDDLDKIRLLLYSQTDEPTADFQAFLDEWQRQRYRPQAVDGAIRWLTSPKDHKPASVEEFHHWLLMLYSHTQLRGGIQGTLLEYFDAKFHMMPAVYVHTLNEESSNTEGLPKLSLVPLDESHGFSGSVVDQLPLEGGLGAAGSSATRFFLDILDTWFRYGPCDRQEKVMSDRIGLHMLWIPVFDFYSNHGTPAGMFQGWIFKFLGPLQDAVALSREGLEGLRTYADSCRVALPLLSDRLYEQAMREVSSQEVVDGDPTETLCKHIHHLEGWAATRLEHEDWAEERPGRAARPLKPRTEGLDVSLRMTRFDDPRLWGETDRPAGPALTLRLVPLDNAEFSSPCGYEFIEKYQDRVAARIRELYRQFRLSDLRVRRAEEAEAQRVKGDLVATFAHTFGKVGDAIDASLAQQSPQSIVKQLRGRLNAAAGLGSSASAQDILRSLSKELEPLATADSNPGVSLFRSFFLPQVAGFYERVLLLDRLRGTASVPSPQPIPIAALVDDVIRGRLLDVACHLQAGNVNETYLRLARGRSVSDLREIRGGGLILFDDSSSGFSTFLPTAQDDGIADLLHECWKTVFFELLINTLEGDGIAATAGGPPITLSCRSDIGRSEGIVRLENMISLDSTRRVAGKTDDGWELLEIRRPTAEQGTRGWGQYGVKFILEQVLRCGTLRASRQPEAYASNGCLLARFDIVLAPRWWCQEGGPA